MLRLNECNSTIGVQGWIKENGQMVFLKSITKRKFSSYPIRSLIDEIKDVIPNVQYIKVYKKTMTSVPFLEWYDTKGRKLTMAERNEIWDMND